MLRNSGSDDESLFVGPDAPSWGYGPTPDTGTSRRRGYHGPVTQDWLLVETLGDEPVVVAQGRQMKNFVPCDTFLRRNPNLGAIRSAVEATLSGASGLVAATTTNRVIHTEPVAMSDGRIHAVHVWCGLAGTEPPERPTPGPLIWNFTTGEASGTVAYLINAGMDPATESTTGRAFIEDMPSRILNRDETKVLAMSIDVAPGRTYCNTWEFTDKQGTFRRVGFVVRTAFERAGDGSEHLIGRAMNLVESVQETPGPGHPAQRILDGLSQPGVYRLVVDLRNWTLLKWLDEPCPYFDWRNPARIHPADHQDFSTRIRGELDAGETSSTILRLPGTSGDWVPLHVTIRRIELDEGVFGGLVTLRLPTADELAAAR